MVATLHDTIWEILESIPDPEIPVLSIVDLGIVRSIDTHNGIEINITPTYVGCPAMDWISLAIKEKLIANGYKQPKINLLLSPAWTTDWLTEAGKAKLAAYGIAPPSVSSLVTCPQCGSQHTKLLSQFGSTACKALYQCETCKEPFDYFKCHR